MRAYARFALLFVAVAGTASARPGPYEPTGRVGYTDRGSDAHPAARRPGEWVEIVSPTPANHGTEFVFVGPDAGSFSRLRIDAHGKVILRQITVVFVDGSEKTVQLRRTLGVRNGPSTTEIELGVDKPIDHVIVTTEANTPGRYTIYGSSSDGMGETP